MLLRFAAAALLSCAAIAAGTQIAAAGTQAEILLAQAQPAAPPQNVDANISILHQRLQITPAQEPQFNAVANAMRENARAEASAPQQPPAGATAVGPSVTREETVTRISEDMVVHGNSSRS